MGCLFSHWQKQRVGQKAVGKGTKTDNLVLVL